MMYPKGRFLTKALLVMDILRYLSTVDSASITSSADNLTFSVLKVDTFLKWENGSWKPLFLITNLINDVNKLENFSLADQESSLYKQKTIKVQYELLNLNNRKHLRRKKMNKKLKRLKRRKRNSSSVSCNLSKSENKNVSQLLIDSLKSVNSYDNGTDNLSIPDNFTLSAANNSSILFQNFTLLEAIVETSSNKTSRRPTYTLYELQLIKVGVLCGVLTLLLLSTCSMLLKVLARHVDRDKSYVY